MVNFDTWSDLKYRHNITISSFQWWRHGHFLTSRSIPPSLLTIQPQGSNDRNRDCWKLCDSRPGILSPIKNWNLSAIAQPVFYSQLPLSAAQWHATDTNPRAEFPIKSDWHRSDWRDTQSIIFDRELRKEEFYIPLSARFIYNVSNGRGGVDGSKGAIRR